MKIIGNYKKIAITLLAIVLGVYGMNAEEKNKSLDDKLASLRNEADAGIKGRRCRMRDYPEGTGVMPQSPGDGARGGEE